MATLVLSRGFQWNRSSAISATLAVHALAALAILAPPALVQMARAPETAPVAITIKPVEPPPPPPPPELIVEHKPRPQAPPQIVRRPEPAPVQQPVIAEPTPQSYPAVPEPAVLPVEPAAPVDTAPSALGYKEMRQVPYPVIAKRQRMEGTVMLRVLVGADGVPQEIEVAKSSGHVLLDRAARDAVMKWRFEPGTRNGQPFAAYGLVPIAFRLTEL